MWRRCWRRERGSRGEKKQNACVLFFWSCYANTTTPFFFRPSRSLGSKNIIAQSATRGGRGGPATTRCARARKNGGAIEKKNTQPEVELRPGWGNNRGGGGGSAHAPHTTNHTKKENTCLGGGRGKKRRKKTKTRRENGHGNHSHTKNTEGGRDGGSAPAPAVLIRGNTVGETGESVRVLSFGGGGERENQERGDTHSGKGRGGSGQPAWRSQPHVCPPTVQRRTFVKMGGGGEEGGQAHRWGGGSVEPMHHPRKHTRLRKEKPLWPGERPVCWPGPLHRAISRGSRTGP